MVTGLNIRFYLTFLMQIILLGDGNCQIGNFDKEFDFSDGIYLSFEQLLNDNPQFELSGSIVENIVHNQVNPNIVNGLSHTLPNGQTKKLNIEDVWSICIDGVPMKLVALRTTVRGSEIYQNYQTSAKYRLIRFTVIGNITAYRDGTTDFLIHSQEKNKSVRLTVKSLSEVIQNDEELFSRFKKDRKKKDNLFAYMSQYNLRNPISVQ